MVLRFFQPNIQRLKMFKWLKIMGYKDVLST